MTIAVVSNIFFIVIGEGPLWKSLQNRIINEKIANVKLLGKRFDIPQWLCAADIFLFPSIYEGLGIVAIEAQSNGLPVLSTDSIPEEADMKMGLFHRIPLKYIERWNKMLRDTLVPADVRQQKTEEAMNSKYNISVVVKGVEDIYMS